jgi:hypothetical protein
VVLGGDRGWAIIKRQITTTQQTRRRIWSGVEWGVGTRPFSSGGASQEEPGIRWPSVVVMRNNDDDASSKMARFLGRALVLFGPTKCFFTELPQQKLIVLRTGLCDNYVALEKCGGIGGVSEKVLISRNVDPADVVVVKRCVVGPNGASGVDRPGLLRSVPARILDYWLVHSPYESHRLYRLAVHSSCCEPQLVDWSLRTGRGSLDRVAPVALRVVDSVVHDGAGSVHSATRWDIFDSNRATIVAIGPLYSWESEPSRVLESRADVVSTPSMAEDGRVDIVVDHGRIVRSIHSTTLESTSKQVDVLRATGSLFGASGEIIPYPPIDSCFIIISWSGVILAFALPSTVKVSMVGDA